MAQGTPVVSTAELGTRSILTPECGAFVVPEEEQAFARAVATALTVKSGDARRAQLRAHAESWASQAMTRRLIAFYERILAAAKQPSRIIGRGPLGTPSRVEQ
jgi:glycosyltransferase involved in cell wall biosynthesis